MEKIFIVFIFLASLFFTWKDHIFAGSVGDPCATLSKGTWAVGLELSWVGREIRDRDGARCDTETGRILLKGSCGISDRLEVFGRLGGVMIKIHGTPFDSNPGVAAGAGLKGTFLDPPGHPLRYGLGGQFLYGQADDG